MHIYPSVTGSFTFFLVWPFGCNNKTAEKRLSQSRIKQKYTTTPSSSHLLTKTIQNRVPTCILNSKVNWNLMFFWETTSISVRKRSLKSYYQPTSHLEKFYGNKTAIPKKNDLTWIAHQLWADSLNRKKTPETGAELTVSTQVTQ